MLCHLLPEAKQKNRYRPTQPKIPALGNPGEKQEAEVQTGLSAAVLQAGPEAPGQRWEPLPNPVP